MLPFWIEQLLAIISNQQKKSPHDVLAHAQGVWEGEGIAPTQSQAGTKRRYVVSTTLRPLHIWQRSSTKCTGGWMGFETCLDNIENFVPLAFDPRYFQTLRNLYTAIVPSS